MESQRSTEMTRMGRNVNAVFLFAGVSVLLLAVLLKLLYGDNSFKIFVGVSEAVSALLASLIGIGAFARGGLARDDGFRLMNLAISVGLVFFFVADVAEYALSSVPQGAQLSFAVYLIQVCGLLFWIIGIAAYLRASNEVLGYVSTRVMWTASVASSILFSSLMLLWETVRGSHPDLFSLASRAPILFGLAFVAISMAALFWIFRTGRLSLPMGLGFTGVFLFLIQNFASQVLLESLTPYMQILAAEAYLILGASLSAAALLQRPSIASSPIDGNHGAPLPPTAGA
ncbi:MAG: hypothetical protein C4K47_07245 [Candidatus Thorarchaeota archaeon]|nr:MAG: hypothetical protein C4K47_07245 [Candidatus Thorarchaeota archaeon]